MLHLSIVTPEEMIFSDTVSDVYLPTTDGEIGVLEMHAALVTPIQPGELRYLKDGEVHELAVGEGFVEVTQEKVSVLTDLAIGEAGIDEAKVEEAMARAQKAIENKEHESEEDFAALQAIIAKSVAQLQLKRKRHH